MEKETLILETLKFFEKIYKKNFIVTVIFKSTPQTINKVTYGEKLKRKSTIDNITQRILYIYHTNLNQINVDDFLSYTDAKNIFHTIYDFSSEGILKMLMDYREHMKPFIEDKSSTDFSDIEPEFPIQEDLNIFTTDTNVDDLNTRSDTEINNEPEDNSTTMNVVPITENTKSFSQEKEYDDVVQLRHILAQNEPTMVYIDGPNLYAGANNIKAHNEGSYELDYRRILEFFRYNSNLMHINYYNIIEEDSAREYNPRVTLYDWLKYNSYNVLLREQYADAAKNVDIDHMLVTDMMLSVTTKPEVRNIILFSGDGDYEYSLDKLRMFNKRVIVISSGLSGKNGKYTLSKKLKMSSDLTVYLEHLIHLFFKQQ